MALLSSETMELSNQDKKIPREIWRFCVDQVKFYPLNEKTYQEKMREIKAVIDDAGLSSPPNQSGVINHTGGSPVLRQYMKKESILNEPHLRYLSRCVAVIGIIQKDNDSNMILNAIWKQGWRDNGLIAHETSVSTRTVARIKNNIIRQIAAGWGLW